LDEYERLTYRNLNDKVLNEEMTSMTKEMRELYDYIINTNRQIEEDKVRK
jgi:hypothetical protein